MKPRSDSRPRILCLAFAVAGLGACSPSESSGSNLRPQLLYVPAQTTTSGCTCTGTGPDGAPVTVSLDGHVYPSLFPGYTHDGGHLNEAGQQVAGVGAIRFMASALQGAGH